MQAPLITKRILGVEPVFCGNSKVKISMLSDGTLVSDRKDPLAATNDGINLNGAKFQ